MIERRQYSRVGDIGMMVVIKSRIVPVNNISLTGANLSLVDYQVTKGEVVNLTFIPGEDKNLKINQSYKIDATVVRLDSNTIGVEFPNINFKFAKFIMNYLSDKLGVEPFGKVWK